MTDPRMEAARRTNQSRGHGWDFRPTPPEPVRPSLVTAILAVVILGWMGLAAVAPIISRLF